MGRYYYCHSIKLLLFAQCPKKAENDACCTFKYCFNPVLCRLLSAQPSKASCSLSLEFAQPLLPASTNVAADQLFSFESFEGYGLSLSILSCHGVLHPASILSCRLKAAEQAHTPTAPPSLTATGFQFHPPRHPPGRLLRGVQLPGLQSWLLPQSPSMVLPKLRITPQPQSLHLYNGSASSSHFLGN